MRLPTSAVSLSALILALGLAACSGGKPKLAASFNGKAELSGELPANPLRWRVITTVINTTEGTMSTLYGNDLAVQYARGHSGHDYPGGAVLSLVTWRQLPDERYFGANIPGPVKSVEFVFVELNADGSRSNRYQEFDGSPRKKVSASGAGTPVTIPEERAANLLSMRAAVMP